MLNAARIAELKREVGEDDFSEVVSLFCEEMEDALTELGAARQDTVRERLHFLKGSAFNIGLDAMGRLCAREEVRLTADQTATPDVAAIRAAYAAAKSELLG